ncbi:mucin-2-like isoform X2 [Crassostrea angulata]|uniref:mucin-2-like isoform X2 n=1 Tax=Magallana angulata TaxID=2784310 RepID=UPI0022B176BB|nr:mucin-2-like isoform X2 [Crassostrea angulata]
MSTNTRLTRYEYIGIHISVIMSAVVLVSNLSSVTSSTTVATTTTTLSPQVTQTTENVNVTSSSPAGNDTTEATTTLQSGSTEETTTTTQPGDTSQSTTSLTTTTTATTTNNSNTPQSPETTIDNMSTQSSTAAMTSETTLTTSDAIPTTTVNTTEETGTTTSLETITTETPHSTPVSTSEGVETTTSTVAPVTVTTTTQDNSSTTETTTQTSTESTEAPSTISTDATQETATTTQGSSDTTTSNTTTPMPVTSTGTPNSTEATTQATTTQDSNNTTAVSDTTTEATSTHSTETTNQTTTTTSVENTTTRPSRASTTTTQPSTTTKSYQIMPVYPDTENAVLEFTFELRFTDCTFNKTTIENKLSVVSSSVDDCKYIRVKSIDEGSCRSGRSKRSATASYISVDTAFGIDAQKGISNGSSVSDDLYTALSNVDDIDVNYLNETKDNFTGALASKQICDSDVCASALVGRPGFVCVADTFTQTCAIMYYCDHQPIDCGKHGHCYVETEIQSERVSYSSKCRCTQEEFFRYEGTHCTERVMTWELAVIICASAFGALILVLLFIIIVMCCRTASNSADVFEDSEVMYTPSGIASANGRNGRDASKGVENQGYMEVRDTSGSWKPEASANTYAHIESKLRENNYDMQIKRPQVTQFRKSDEITEF